ncbi:hypothetical protein GWI33_013385 [Rhynchophorus ferrugineus]|uniref:Malate dehydrogenase n=1 Tax=Rhynchophorus ferrugineus TaxID=354439 RepID=A0A834I4Q0_RHYFE|nr:hypothetical protein GWI33_013385 [Rhynchophorus ferrugineus]
MSIKHLFKTIYNHKIIPSFCTQPEYQKSIQVCILGADTRIGCEPIYKIGEDLGLMDTSCMVQAYCGIESGIEKAIKCADVVVILPKEKLNTDTPIGERVMAEGHRLHSIAVKCTIFSPRAILVNCVPPVSVTTPLISEVFKKTNFYHPGRIIGSAAFAQTKVNSLLARYQDLDPQSVYTPLIGGPEVDLAVPLFSQAKPVEVIGKKNQMSLTAKFRGILESEFPKILGRPNHRENSTIAESYGISNLVATIALGLCGDANAHANVYLRSNAVPACKYLVSTVRFSRGGVVHNYGIPQLPKHELDLLEKSSLEIKAREQMALEYLDYLQNHDKPTDMPPFREKENKKQELLKQRIVR